MKLRVLQRLQEQKRKDKNEYHNIKKGENNLCFPLFVFKIINYFGFIAFSIRATKSFKWNLVNLSVEVVAATFN